MVAVEIFIERASESSRVDKIKTACASRHTLFFNQSYTQCFLNGLYIAATMQTDTELRTTTLT